MQSFQILRYDQPGSKYGWKEEQNRHLDGLRQFKYSPLIDPNKNIWLVYLVKIWQAIIGKDSVLVVAATFGDQTSLDEIRWAEKLGIRVSKFLQIPQHI
jgi:hypothetical protein